MNKLEEMLGLVEPSPTEALLIRPSAKALKSIPKNEQTYDMLIWVCSEDGLALEYASKKLITSELCEIAVKQNGLALKFIPEKISRSKGVEWLRHICEVAVTSNCLAFQYVPNDFLNADMVEKAVLSDGGLQDIIRVMWNKHPISYVPDGFLTKDLLIRAVEHFPFCMRDIPSYRITKELSILAVSHMGMTLKFIPPKFIDKELVSLAISNTPRAIKFVPKKYLTSDLCRRCYESDCTVLGYIPSGLITLEMCLNVIDQKKYHVFQLSNREKRNLFGDEKISLADYSDFPDEIRNNHVILDAINNCFPNSGYHYILIWHERIKEKKKESPTLCFNKRGEAIEPLRDDTVGYLQTKINESEAFDVNNPSAQTMVSNINWNSYAKESKLPLPTKLNPSFSLVPVSKNTLSTYDFSETDSFPCRIYYISDIHIEHQLEKYHNQILKKPQYMREKYIAEIICDKIKEMLQDVPVNSRGILLIGGDVADSKELSTIFYNLLYQYWNGGTVISVLGNHELWDGTSLFEWCNPKYVSRPIETIVEDYRAIINKGGVLLENALYIRYKNRCTKIISESEIMEASLEDLADLLSKCTLIILGGLGYSGLNPEYNSDKELYRKAIIFLEEDILRTKRFRDVYNKIRQCVKNRRVIVLTHTQVSDWTNDACEEKWIYVNGHTHRNALSIPANGPIILSDNQIGYKPQKWILKSFTIDTSWYDPFETYGDGIYTINTEQYLDFNRGRGIYCTGCGYEGTIYMLKRNNIYMFLLESSKSLCLLAGGHRKKLERYDIHYYYDNLERYCAAVIRTIEPFQTVIKKVSEEVKKIGGTGVIHGCIVDIRDYSHIYINPFDGKLTSYWAPDITKRLKYNSIQMLLEEKEPDLLGKFIENRNKHSIPLIDNHLMPQVQETELPVIPEWVLGTQIYEPSRIMKAIQYVWEQNVIRIWNDDILNTDILSYDKPLLELE